MRLSFTIFLANFAFLGFALYPLSVSEAGKKRSTAKLYQSSCHLCHETGSGGAQKRGDKAAWATLLKKKGMPALVKSVRTGKGTMPALGFCSDCSDSELQALIEFMAK